MIEIQELFDAGFCSTGVRQVLPVCSTATIGDLLQLAGTLQEARKRLQRELEARRGRQLMISALLSFNAASRARQVSSDSGDCRIHSSISSMTTSGSVVR